MNLFCFSLEGSTDSLYEAAPSRNGIEDYGSIPSRPCSSALHKETWQGSEPCLAMDPTQEQTSSLKKKKRRSQVPTSSLDNETLDPIEIPATPWQSTRKTEESVHIKDHQNQVTGKDVRRASLQTVNRGEDREGQLNSKRENDISLQVLNFESWNPNWEPSDSHQQDTSAAMEAEVDPAESMGTLKRIQRLVRARKGNPSGPEEGRNTSENSAYSVESTFKDDSPVITCIGLGKNPEKKPSKEAPQKRPPIEDQGLSGDCPWNPGAHDKPWSPLDFPPPWDTSYHTCHRPLDEAPTYDSDLPLPWGTDWDRFECLAHELNSKSQPAGQRVVRSITDLEISESTCAEGEQAGSSDHTKPGSLGRKMKAISLTVKKKMGRKYSKAMAEDMGQETQRCLEGEVDGSYSLEKECRRSSHSVESLYSLNSRQSSSSGITSGSDGSSNRDSIRMEEEIPYTGLFCGKAKVHTNFVPSPYDTDSLKLKVGDVIDIISKPPMGIWTGMLHNKVGNFKFIYVDVLVEKMAEPARRPRTHRRSRRPRPKTLQELLERLNLEEYVSALLLNGYQTVEDLKELREQHLLELNVKDPEDRHRLLSAVEYLQEAQQENQKESEVEPEPRSPSDSIKDLNDCPRDSGCYIPTECFDTGREDADSQLPSLV